MLKVIFNYLFFPCIKVILPLEHTASGEKENQGAQAPGISSPGSPGEGLPTITNLGGKVWKVLIAHPLLAHILRL